LPRRWLRVTGNTATQRFIAFAFRSTKPLELTQLVVDERRDHPPINPRRQVRIHSVAPRQPPDLRDDLGGTPWCPHRPRRCLDPSHRPHEVSPRRQQRHQPTVDAVDAPTERL